MGSPLIWLSGAQQDILARCPADRPKYAGIGSAVLITATMAGVSMTFALHSALKVPLAWAIPFAVAWGFAIMSLDRWLVVSLVRQRNKLNYLLLALPRAALAVLFGLIISTPFTLQIFQPEINRQITVILQQHKDDYYRKQATSQLTKRIKDEQSKVSTDEKIIRSGGGTGDDSILIGLNQRLNQDRVRENSYYREWTCQLYGGPSCVVKGNGPAAQTAKQAYDQARQDVIKDNKDIRDREQALRKAAPGSVENARGDLAQNEADLARDTAARKKSESDFERANASNAGLLLRLQALDQFAAGSGTLQAARWLLFLFFTAIECLPVLVKILLNLGPENTYEKALAHAEQAGLRLAEQEITLAAEALTAEAERLHAEWKADVLPDVIHDATAARDRVARARLARWEWKETACIDDRGLIGLGGLSEAGTGWTVARGRNGANGSAITSRLRAARQARGRTKTPNEPAHPSAGPLWPDSL